MAEAGTGNGSRSVLIVEDEPGVRLFVQTVLVRNGYSALAAGTAEEALRVAREHPGDLGLVISDLLLPDMNGRTLVGLLRESSPKLPAVFISGFPRSDAGGGAFDGEHFVAKPFRAIDLLQEMARALPPHC